MRSPRPAGIALAFLAALHLAGPILAETCPAASDRTEDLSHLFTEAQRAGSAAEGQAISNRMWEVWAEAPDARAQALLDDGLRRRSAYDFDRAVTAFEALIAYCPDYAEGYNQRAFIAFIRQDYPAALEDLDRALDRSPLHVAAMAGKALTLMGLGRMEEGQTVLRGALKLNPWLPERGLLQTEPGEKNDTF